MYITKKKINLETQTLDQIVPVDVPNPERVFVPNVSSCSPSNGDCQIWEPQVCVAGWLSKVSNVFLHLPLCSLNVLIITSVLNI